MNRVLSARFLLSFVLATAAIAQCPPQGLSLTVTGKRLGDPASLHVTGIPFASGILAFDTAGGPTLTSVGTACLGMTSQLQCFPFTFGSDGMLSIQATIPASPGLNGLTLFMQAVAVDLTEPNPLSSIAWSNGATITLSSPKLVIVDPGYPLYPWAPGAFCIYDALTDLPTTPAIPLASLVRQVITIRNQGLVAILLQNNTIVVYDVNTAALVATIPLPFGMGGPGDDPRRLATDGSNLYVLYRGLNPPPGWGSGAPGSVRSYALPSGAPVLTTPLPSGNPDDLLIIPGSNIAYLNLYSTYTLPAVPSAFVLPIDLTTGATLPAINLGTGFPNVSEWVVQNGVVYCLLIGAFTSFPPTSAPPHALAAFNTTTNALLTPSPVTFAGWPYTLRQGPGTGGAPAIFAQVATPFPALLEISPTTLAVVNTIPTNAPVSDMQLSSGGTEWLLLTDNGQKQLATMTPPVLSPTVLTALPSTTEAFIHPLSSVSVFKAYITFDAASITSFATDPAAPPSPAVPLPLVSSNGYLIVD